MNLSSILVFAVPKQIDKVRKALLALPGVEVHYECRDTGRLVVIQESADTQGEVDGLARIKALRYVRAADLVYHYFEGEAAGVAPLPAICSDIATELRA